MTDSLAPTDLLIPVLLVEDDSDQVRLMMLALRDLPVSPKHVGTLREAIAELERVPDFALVLLDLHLPDSRGVEGVQRIAQLHDTIIVLTSSGQRYEDEALRAGADDYLPKNAPHGAIRHAVRCALERRIRRLRVMGALR